MSAPPPPPNGTADPLAYDPSAPVPYWHQNLELAVVCTFNAMTLFLIVTRVTVRRMRLGRFRKDDIWLMVAGAILVFPYWVSQIGTNRYGSGLHVWNVPTSWYVPFFEFEWGWVGYYIVASMIKVSVLYGFLEILPPAFYKLRTFVYVLCVMICSLGFAEASVWIFQCQPFLSNFVYSVESTWCLNIDDARYSWVGISVAFDFCIVCIPFAILRQIRLKSHERMVLLAVFGANLLGTCACALGSYGIWLNNNAAADSDLAFSESVFVMLSDVEIFLYTLGASATMASRYFISKAESISARSSSRTSDWRKEISWPTSNESYHSRNPSKSSKLSTAGRAFGSLGLKRGFKGSDVEILEGFDLQESPRSWSTPTPRSAHPLMSRESNSVSRPILQTPGPMGATPELIDVGGLIGPPRRTATAPLSVSPPRRTNSGGPTPHVPFSPVEWHQRSYTASSPIETVREEPWEGRGPIDGWSGRH